MSLNLAPDSNLSQVLTMHPYCGGLTAEGVINDGGGNLSYGGAVNDRGYRMKCASYDELKLDSMKVTLTPAQLATNSNITFTLCTMWDRKASPKEIGYQGGGEWMQNGAVPTALEIFNNEGTIKSQMNQNTIYGYKRYCKASSIIEKGGYIDASILYHDTEGESPLKILYQDAWLRNPCPFSPSLNICVYSPAKFQAAATITFSYKVEYTFTFRNPKSDLDWFLQVETPGFVNTAATAGRGGELSKNNARLYELAAIRSQPIPTIIETVTSLFAPREEKKAEEQKSQLTEVETLPDTPMDVEDDPGTA